MDTTWRNDDNTGSSQSITFNTTPKNDDFFPQKNIHYHYDEQHETDRIKFIKAIAPTPTEAEIATNYFSNKF